MSKKITITVDEMLEEFDEKHNEILDKHQIEINDIMEDFKRSIIPRVRNVIKSLEETDDKYRDEIDALYVTCSSKKREIIDANRDLHVDTAVKPQKKRTEDLLQLISEALNKNF